MPSQDDVRWARVKSTAARWFARLEADERRVRDRRPARPPLRSAPRDDVPEIDPADVVELAPAVAGPEAAR